MTFQEAKDEYARGFHKNSLEQRWSGWEEYHMHLIASGQLDKLLDDIDYIVENMNSESPLITEQFLLSKGWVKKRKRVYEHLISMNYIKLLNDFGDSEENRMWIKQGNPSDQDNDVYFGPLPTESQYEVLNQLLKLHP